MKLRRRLAATLAIGLLAAACGGGSDDPAASDTEAAGTEGEEQVLRLWHYEAPTSAMGIAWDRAMEILEEENPGVRVEFEEKGFEQIQETASMVLNSGQAPDIMEYNKGNATAGLLASQGLLTDITAEVESRGWDQLLSESLQTTARYEDGQMGAGAWYGIPNYAEFVLFYYNQDLFDEHGVEVPTTLEELEAAMRTFTDAGVTPLAFSGSEYPAQQYWYQLALSRADRSLVDAYQLYDGEVDFHDDAFTFAAERLTDWVEQGYISTDATGLPAEDMGLSFISGQQPMMLSGTWWYGRLINEIDDFEWSSFLFPGSDLYPGSSGNLWVVPEGAANKELAYEFIDITMRPEIQNILGNEGGLPVAADPEAITDDKSQELVEHFNVINEKDGLAFYPDWPAPGFYDTLVSNVQNLVSGRSSVEGFLDAIAGPYEEHVSSLR
ncbi:extracellular solute-binding protein [Nitriliruptor alkaliphilus]|uniref:ABC transporter substrate-binding protein n=1 Tax=Nitriliruptor alkaliphilus TaxID=427918 RepID=UPI000A8CE35A|nr:extracellular solute-binding protein [Nitriliruptor alkaliphilus]